MKVEASPEGFYLPEVGLHLDPLVPVPRAVFSHAHADHARALCGRVYASPETAAVARLRLGETEYVVSGPGQPLDVKREGFAPCRLTLFPAGHVLGSSLVRVEGPAGSLLFTGDVNLVPSLTCTPAEVPEANLLLTESTFGREDLRFPPVAGLRRRIVDLARGALAAGETPVFLGYAFGKGPEVTKILLDAGVPVAVHEAIVRLLRVYRRAGFAFGKTPWFGKKRRPAPGHALVVPPSARWHPALLQLPRPRFVAVTGRAILDPSRRPFRADEAVPLSDHADFDGLLRVARLSGARAVLTTHGFAGELAAALCERGTDARPLAGAV